MRSKSDFVGIYTAVVTPFDENDKPVLGNLLKLIGALTNEGVNGILLGGTTGEGPSLSLIEQEQIIEAVLDVTKDTDLIVMAGTGRVSIKDTIYLTQRAFKQGVDAVVVLPPYYFKKITVEGLLNYYRRIIDEAVPDGKQLFLYDIPQITGISMPNELFEKLLKHHEDRFCGVKDSIGKIDHSIELINMFPQLNIMIGDDKLILQGLEAGAAGSITAGTNVLATYASKLYKAFLEKSVVATELQKELTAARSVLDKFTPYTKCLKSLLSRRFGKDGWNVRLPLLPFSNNEQNELIHSLNELDLRYTLGWTNIEE